MNFKFLNAVVTIAVLTFCNHASASLIKTTMDLTITNVNGDYAAVTVNDVFQFEAYYDDADTHMQISDNGDFCLDTHIPTPTVNCVSTYSAATYRFFSDMTNNLYGLFDEPLLLAGGNVFYNRTNTNRSSVYGIGIASITTHINDDRMYGYIYDHEANSTVAMFYKDSDGRQRTSTVSFGSSNIVVQSVDVPEPSTLAIFALGMIGLASRRFKKQS